MHDWEVGRRRLLENGASGRDQARGAIFQVHVCVPMSRCLSMRARSVPLAFKFMCACPCQEVCQCALVQCPFGLPAHPAHIPPIAHTGAWGSVLALPFLQAAILLECTLGTVGRRRLLENGASKRDQTRGASFLVHVCMAMSRGWSLSGQ